MTRTPDPTELLRRSRAGDEAASEAFVQLVYDELRQTAARLMERERPDHTLQPTALLNEAYARLLQSPDDRVATRQHFLRRAAQVMRHVLVDHARARSAKKRGGEQVRITLIESTQELHFDPIDLLAVDDILQSLARMDPELEEIVELRYFGGLSDAEIAKARGMSLRSVQRSWRTARAFVTRTLAERPSE